MDKKKYIIPKLKDLRIDKLKYFEMIKDFKDIADFKVNDIVEINSVFTGLDYPFLRTVTKKQNYELFNKILDLVSKYKRQPLKDSITIKGQKYVRSESFNDMPTSFWLDLANQDIAENPIRIASCMYIEEGMEYSEINDKKVVLNPPAKRDEIFKEHLPLTDYLDMQGFFLPKYNELTALYMTAKEKQRLKQQTHINGIR